MLHSILICVGSSIKTISHIKLDEWNLFILGKICTMFQFGRGITDKGISN